MLPNDVYTSADVLAWELEHFFQDGWVSLCRASDLASPGTSERPRGSRWYRPHPRPGRRASGHLQHMPPPGPRAARVQPASRLRDEPPPRADGCGPDRVECRWLFPPGAAEREDFDPGYASGFWDVTNRRI